MTHYDSYFQIPLDHKEFTSIVNKIGNPVKGVPDIKPEEFKSCLCEISETHDQQFGIPTLDDLKLPQPQAISCWIGGELNALQRLAEKMKDAKLMTVDK